MLKLGWPEYVCLKETLVLLNGSRDRVKLASAWKQGEWDFKMEARQISLHSDLDASVELLLVLCCARTTVTSELSSSLTKLTRQITDWDCVIRFAEEHGLLLFLLRQINLTAPTLLPQTMITGARRRHASRNRLLLMEFHHVTSLFAAHKIRAISYKGPTLTTIVYPSLQVRVSDDLDFLVHPRDYDCIKTFLIAQGYVLSIDCGYKYHLWHPTKHVDLDIHRALVPRWYKFRFGFDHAWEQSMPLVVPYESSVSTFCLEHLVIVLCLDLVKDIAQPRNFRLIKITDIVEVLRCSERIDWTVLTNEMQSMGLSRVTYFGLLLADRVYGITLPPQVRHEMLSQTPLLHRLVNLVMRMVLDEKFSFRMTSPRPLHEARTIIIFQDDFKDQLFVTALYLVRPVRLRLKNFFAAVANFIRRSRRGSW